MSTLILLLALLPFYLLGAFPTGRIVSRFHGINIESSGSGNVGATNVARTLGKRAGIIVLACDLFKGVFAVVLARLIFGESPVASAAGAAAVFGHCFSIPGVMRGGKGVATSLGVLLVFTPAGAIITLLVFAAVFFFTRIISLASMLAALSAPIWAMMFGVVDDVVVAICAMALVIVFRHRQNIERLIQGREPRFATKPSA